MTTQWKPILEIRTAVHAAKIQSKRNKWCLLLCPLRATAHSLSGIGGGSACINYSMWAGLVIITKSFMMMVFKSEACAALIYSMQEGFHLGSGSAGKCEENISVKRPEIANYFELIIFHIWLDARLSNFDGQHSITPRFYPCDSIHAKLPLGCEIKISHCIMYITC